MKLTTYREDHSLDVPRAVAVESLGPAGTTSLHAGRQTAASSNYLPKAPLPDLQKRAARPQARPHRSNHRGDFRIRNTRYLPALDGSGNHVASDESEIPTTTREKRWLELYGKHDKSWRDWMVETYADRCVAFNIS
jgi:hypothetical protein